MKTKLYIIVVVSCLYSFVACEDSRQITQDIGVAEVVNYEKVKRLKFDPKIKKSSADMNMKTLLDTMFMVRLSDETLIAEITKMRVFEEQIFIFDDRAQAISVFDFYGNLKAKISRKGKGPGEYVKIADFTIEEETKSILILDQFNRKIITYSFEGEFQTEQRYTTHARYFNMLGPDHYVIFNDFNGRWKGVNYNLFVTNLEGEVNSHTFPYSNLQAQTDRVKDSYLNYHNSRSANYIGHYDNHVYRVTKDSVWAEYYLDFGKANLPEDIVHNSFEALDGYVNNISNFFETSDFLSFTHIYDKTLYVRYYDKVADQVISEKLSLANLLYFYANFPVKTVYDDFFVNIASAEYYPELFSYENLIPANSKYSAMLKELKQVETEDNPIVFFYRMKSPMRQIENKALKASLDD